LFSFRKIKILYESGRLNILEISKEEAEVIRLQFPKVFIYTTSKQHSKKKKRHMEENIKAVKFLKQLRSKNIIKNKYRLD